MAIEIDEPTIFENVLHYGLLLGALFQMICIFAVIFIPKSDIDKEYSPVINVVHGELKQTGRNDDDEEDIKTPSNTQPHQASNQPSSSSKKSKREKKKNR